MGNLGYEWILNLRKKVEIDAPYCIFVPALKPTRKGGGGNHPLFISSSEEESNHFKLWGTLGMNAFERK